MLSSTGVHTASDLPLVHFPYLWDLLPPSGDDLQPLLQQSYIHFFSRCITASPSWYDFRMGYLLSLVFLFRDDLCRRSLGAVSAGSDRITCSSCVVTTYDLGAMALRAFIVHSFWCLSNGWIPTAVPALVDLLYSSACFL